MSSGICFNLDQSKILSSGIGLRRKLLKTFWEKEQMLVTTTLKMEAFENILKKRENAGNQHFLLCPKSSFLPVPKQISHLFYCLQGFSFSFWIGLKFCCLVKSSSFSVTKGFHFGLV